MNLHPERLDDFHIFLRILGFRKRRADGEHTIARYRSSKSSLVILVERISPDALYKVNALKVQSPKGASILLQDLERDFSRFLVQKELSELKENELQGH